MSEISKQALKVDNNTSFPNNTTGYISPTILRAFNTNMIDSLVDEIPYQSFTASVTNSIQLLNAYTASIQPGFTSLNAFTASQLTINTGYNATTQSLSVSISSLDTTVAGIQLWTASVNEISFNSGIPGFATRWNFGGFISASFVENVGGRIADITVLQDPTKLNTSSFNDYTASTNTQINSLSSSQAVWNASATASIQQLLNLSSSLSGGYATQGELDAVSSSLSATITSVSASLTNTINTKLNTSSFNAFTQSQNNLNVTYATTGSNTFIGNEIISGTFIQSGSNSLSGGPNGVNVGTHIKNRVLISGPSSGQTPRLYISGSDGAFSEFGRGFITQDTRKTPSLGSSIYQVGPVNTECSNIVSVANNDYSVDVEFQMFANTSSIGFADFDNGSTFSYVPFMTLEPNVGQNPAPRFTRGLVVTGSALGNIIPLTITSQTASMNLSLGNFFTLNLVSGSSTHLAASNIKPGQTINLLITQSTPASGSLTYSPTFKFPNGASYVQTNIAGAKDILTFITFDNSTIYSTPVNNLL